MSMVTGIVVGGAIMLLGAIGMMLLGMYLVRREQTRRTVPLDLTHEDAQRLVTLIETLEPLKKQVQVVLDSASPSGSPASK